MYWACSILEFLHGLGVSWDRLLETVSASETQLGEYPETECVEAYLTAPLFSSAFLFLYPPPLYPAVNQLYYQGGNLGITISKNKIVENSNSNTNTVIIDRGGEQSPSETIRAENLILCFIGSPFFFGNDAIEQNRISIFAIHQSL
jgi:hypothetical protein